MPLTHLRGFGKKLNPWGWTAQLMRDGRKSGKGLD
jgi:hypothetical protein